METKHKGLHAISLMSNFGYILACFLLYGIAFWIILGCVWSIITDVFYSKVFTIYNLLDEVALIVFAIALIDVAKYLLIEEVIISEKRPGQKETNQTLSKFTIIIVNALFLKGLVMAIEVAKTDIQKIIYPISLLLAGGLLIVALGIYQKLTSASDEESASNSKEIGYN